jgi:NodT family efflux transporter outer membrane factor (OMF) lipoprotein
MMRGINWRLATIAALVAGCSLAPEYKRPQAPAPDQWKHESNPKPASTASKINLTWWKLFGSSELDRLMTEALNNNLDLAAARQRISQSRALAKIAGAPLFPAIGATGSYNYSASTRSVSGADTGEGRWTMSYEVDLWGGIRAGRDSAKSHLDTARFTLEALKLVVMGDVARSYFAVVGLKQRRRIAENNLENIDTVLNIIVARFEAGAISALEVAQQKTERANAAASVALLDQQIAQAENALAVLLGRPPQQFEVTENSLQFIHIPKANIGKPASLFDRRPDIRSAETELMAAHADIGKARAAFYPRLQLGADNIFSAAAMSQPAGIAIMMASSLTAPIFQGGRLEGELERTQARRIELLEIYRKNLLTAYQEVEDALALGSQSMRRHEQLQLSVDSAKQAYEIARDRYLAGATDYQTLLNAQRSWLNAQDSEVQAQADVLTASVLLFKSLGGGWSNQ